MDRSKKYPEIRNLALCPGSLGLEKGISKVIPNLRNVCYVEIEAFIIWNLVSQMEKGFLDPAPIWTNLKTFDPKPFYGKIHSITAGYPCQPFSLAGSRRGTSDPRHLWPYISKSIESIRPVFCFFENVPDHLSMGFPQVYKSLQSLGYRTEAGLFSAAEMGAPQIRQRLFILAYTNREELRGCLANPNDINGIDPKKSEWRSKASIAKSGEILANPKDKGWSDRRESKPYREPEKSEFSRPSHGSKIQRILADPNGSRSPKSDQRDSSKEFNKAGIKWPAKPGEAQYEWEEPRITKPGLGCSAHGYNFRTELLRMYGNAVVPQVAEKAFRHLVNQVIN